ncbi:MAG: hypothetical protein LBI45_07605 [Bacteroidales bacterium]|jgi:predicted helicase|nr:hypothetical protein [Bacteroidales bacterium]
MLPAIYEDCNHVEKVIQYGDNKAETAISKLIIDLLKRICTVSVEKMKIIEERREAA